MIPQGIDLEEYRPALDGVPPLCAVVPRYLLSNLEIPSYSLAM